MKLRDDFQQLFLEDALPKRFCDWWVLDELEVTHFSSHSWWFVDVYQAGTDYWDYSLFIDFYEEIAKENKFGRKTQTKKQKEVEDIFDACFDLKLMREMDYLYRKLKEMRLGKIYLDDMRDGVSKAKDMDEVRTCFVGEK